MTAVLPINPNTALARVAASLPGVTHTLHDGQRQEDFCGLQQTMSDRETDHGTKYEVARWTCPNCGKACSCIYVDGEWCHGDSLSISFGPEKDADDKWTRHHKCTACWVPAGVPTAKPIPATLKCPEPNLTSLLEDALDAERRFGMECARNKNTYEYGDEPDTRKLFAEVKRLEAAGESLGEILETTTGVLLVLSRLWLEGALTADEMAAVSKFRSAEMEAS